MGELGIYPHEITTSTILRACAEVGAWREAIWILEDQLEREAEEAEQRRESSSAPPSAHLCVKNFASVIRACLLVEEWPEVARWYEVLKARGGYLHLRPEISTPALEALCELGQNEEAAELMRNVSRGGWLRYWHHRRYTLEPAFLDTRDLHPKVAALALRMKFDDMLQFSPEKLAKRGKENPYGFVVDIPPVPQDIVIVLPKREFIDQDLNLRPDGVAETIYKTAREVLGVDAKITASNDKVGCFTICKDSLEIFQSGGEAQQPLAVEAA